MKFLATLCAFFFSSVLCSASVDKIIVFGDSLSDNGNLYDYMKQKFPMSPPYYKGRFTNGPVWIEIIANKESVELLDYAFGGAGILKEEDDDGSLFTLKNEVDSFLLANQGIADPNALFVVWIGSNNYLGTPEDTDGTLDLVLGSIDTQLKRLLTAGARHVLLVNLPNLGHTPAARELGEVELLTKLSTLHNQKLLTNFEQYKLDYPQVDWVFLDVDSMLDEVIRYPESLGFSNVKDTCYEAVLEQGKGSVLKMVASIKPKPTADACTGFLFFDPVHPAALAHEILAERARKALIGANVNFVQRNPNV